MPLCARREGGGDTELELEESLPFDEEWAEPPFLNLFLLGRLCVVGVEVDVEEEFETGEIFVVEICTEGFEEDIDKLQDCCGIC